MCCQGSGAPLRGGVFASVSEGLSSVPSTTARSGRSAQKEVAAGSRPDPIALILWTLQPPGQLDRWRYHCSFYTDGETEAAHEH